VAAEADIANRRVKDFSADAFFALDIASQRRPLNRWQDIEDAQYAAAVLIEALAMGKKTAAVAAVALASGPPEVVIPPLQAALPLLESSRDHQRVAAHALAQLTGDEPLAEWASSDNATLRLVAAERLPPTVDGALNPLLAQLTLDADRHVADIAVHGVAEARSEAAAAQLASVASSRYAWSCVHCGAQNEGTDDHCTECPMVSPNPAETARKLLAQGGV